MPIKIRIVLTTYDSKQKPKIEVYRENSGRKEIMIRKEKDPSRPKEK
jgi:hypothetical protein